MTFKGVRLFRFINQEKVEEIPFLWPSKASDYLDLFTKKKLKKFHICNYGSSQDRKKIIVVRKRLCSARNSYVPSKAKKYESKTYITKSPTCPWNARNAKNMYWVWFIKKSKLTKLVETTTFAISHNFVNEILVFTFAHSQYTFAKPR